MRLLLDEMIGPRVAQALRERGHDVIAVAERTDLRAVPDDAVLEFARDDERALVTCNVGDFARVNQQWLAEGRRHFGIVMVTAQRFPQNRGFVGALLDALLSACVAASLPGPGEVLFLGRQTGSGRPD